MTRRRHGRLASLLPPPVLPLHPLRRVLPGAPGAVVAAGVRPGLLALEPAVGLQPLGRDGARHRAPGLARVAAVGEAAAARQRLDVGEHAGQAVGLLPDPRELQPRGVDDRAAAGQRHELAPGRGVAAAVVGLADRAGRARAAGQRVEQRGLADPGGAQQHAGHAGTEQRGDRVEPAAVHGRERQHRRGAADRGSHLGHARGRVGVEIGLRQHDERVGGRVGGQGEHALDAAERQLAVHRRDDDHDVDVGGQHLRLAAAVRRPHERRRALLHGVDGTGLGVGDDPVTDRGEVEGAGGGVPQPAGEEAGARAGLGDELQAAAMDRSDAGEMGQRKAP